MHNLSDQPQELRLNDLNLVATDEWHDLISGYQFGDADKVYTLPALPVGVDYPTR